MTQFALVITKNCCDHLIPISSLGDGFILEIARNLFPYRPFEEIFVLEIEGKNIDDLMVEAQKLIAESLDFKETELYQTIELVAPNIDELVFWYSSDCENLKYTDELSVLLSELEQAVNESNCELYIHFKQKKV